MEFRVLGPLDVRLDDEAIAIGGGKQRAVLAVLLLRAGEVVSVERLVDEVWGEAPPPSAAHTLESYVSRLRQVFNGRGPRIVRKGTGYALELGDATLDARDFVDVQEHASLAAAMDECAKVVELTGAALAMWRGAALADVALASAGRAEADRLEELRLRTYELRFDAELALARHEQAIGELQKLVAQNPYRERFVAQLMLALYRCGRHAEALEAYEHTRRRLNDDLALQPSADLQLLSGQIVRQETHLRAPARVTYEPRRSRRSGRMATLVAGGVAAAAVMTLTASGSTPPRDVLSTDDRLSTNRVALVLSRMPGASADDVRARESLRHFRQLTDGWDHETETVSVAGPEPDPTIVRRAVERVERGNFDLVLVAGERAVTTAFAELAHREEATHFVFLDESLASLSANGLPNAMGIRFAVEESSFIVGYLSGLVSWRAGASMERADAVSVIVANRTPQARRALSGYRLGVRRANPQAAVRVVDSGDVLDKTTCERIANEQVDAGSDILYALAGHPCSDAVFAVARIRGVWAILSDTDGGYPPSRHLLLATYKWWERAISDAVNGFELGSLPAGRDLVLGLADDYSVGFDAISTEIPERDWSKVVALCSRVRQGALDVP